MQEKSAGQVDYRQLCKQVCLLAVETGDYLREERQRVRNMVVEAKGMHDYVTQFDKESERRIVLRLSELLPGSGFIAEEGTAQSDGSEEHVWIVDPLDGTTNFIHGLRTTCVSIGLRSGNKMTLGVVYEIWGQECFYAYEGAGAYLNGAEIHVSSAAAMSDSLLATGFPYTDFSRMAGYMRYLEWTMRHTRGVRRLGSAAADLAYVACGRVDGFFEYGLKPYDVAAGACIVQHAGGRVCDFSGQDGWLFGGEIVCSGPALFPELSQGIADRLRPRGLLGGWRWKA